MYGRGQGAREGVEMAGMAMWALNLLDRSRAPHLLARSSEATIMKSEVPASRAIAAVAGKDGTRRIGKVPKCTILGVCAQLGRLLALERGAPTPSQIWEMPRGKNHAGFVSAISGGVSEANWPIHQC